MGCGSSLHNGSGDRVFQATQCNGEAETCQTCTRPAANGEHGHAAAGSDGETRGSPGSPVESDGETPWTASGQTRGSPGSPVDSCTARSAPSAAGAAGEQEEDWSWCRTVLGRYRVRGVDVLGVGAFSVVRRGVDSGTGAEVAVKSLKDSNDAKFRREIFLFGALFGQAPHGHQPHRSATLMAAELSFLTNWIQRPQDMFVQMLGHSGLDDFARGEPCYSALELGQFTLDELVRHCADAVKAGSNHCLVAQDELLRVLVQLLRALAFLHSRLFIHGDLKPANLMWFQASGSWKLIDLDGLLTSSQLLDMRDADFYTPIYAAPELASAVVAEGPLRVSRCLDVWSAGATVLEMELLAAPLWRKFDELCAGCADGIGHFMRWLSQAPSPMPIPVTCRVASQELLEIMQSSMLVVDPAARQPPAELIKHPYLVSAVSEAALKASPPTLAPAPAPEPPKAKTAFQLFHELQKPELEREGLKGAQLLRELQKRWKALLAEGGEELERLKQRELDLKAAVAAQ